jgi:glycosyltransferase involved in cell wall biosynthesis
MAKIGLIQADLHRLGGGQVVCMNVIEALQDDHDIEVLTTGTTDIEGLDEHADTNVRSVQARSLGTLPEYVNRYRGDRFVLLEVALLNRCARQVADEYDLLVSTVNELNLSPPSVQYVHVPQFNRPAVPGESDVDTPVYQLYRRLCKRVAGVDGQNIERGRLLANSEWTAGVTESIYGTRPEVLYPPIKEQQVPQRPWADREDGFVAVGRLDPTKNHERMLRIVDELRDRGREVHLHIVGPADTTEYVRRIRKQIESRPYAFHEGKVSRERLFELLSRHRYGLHAKDFEHFGMAVAEMVLAGAIPFVPRNGGQQEIVDGDDRLLYESIEDAVEKISVVLHDPGQQQSIRKDLPDIEERFGRHRFRARIRRIVDETLSEDTPRVNA